MCELFWNHYIKTKGLIFPCSSLASVWLWGRSYSILPLLLVKLLVLYVRFIYLESLTSWAQETQVKQTVGLGWEVLELYLISHTSWGPNWNFIPPPFRKMNKAGDVNFQARVMPTAQNATDRGCRKTVFPMQLPSRHWWRRGNPCFFFLLSPLTPKGREKKEGFLPWLPNFTQSSCSSDGVLWVGIAVYVPCFHAPSPRCSVIAVCTLGKRENECRITVPFLKRQGFHDCPSQHQQLKKVVGK